MKAASLRFFQSGVVLIAIAFIAFFFFTALPRLRYPYDLDFIEDSMLMQSLQIAQGKTVYVPPNADFNPMLYMPLFFWLGAVLFKVSGPSSCFTQVNLFCRNPCHNNSHLFDCITGEWVALDRNRLRRIIPGRL